MERSPNARGGRSRSSDCDSGPTGEFRVSRYRRRLGCRTASGLAMMESGTRIPLMLGLPMQETTTRAKHQRWTDDIGAHRINRPCVPIANPKIIAQCVADME